MRPIDADVLIEPMENACMGVMSGCSPFNEPVKVLKSAPTIDAVEVIRCQDCEHYHKNVWGGDIGIGKPYDNIIVGHHGCDRWVKGDDKDMAYTSPDGFCFLGERKE